MRGDSCVVTHAFESLKVLRNDTVMSHPSRNHNGIVTWWPKTYQNDPKQHFKTYIDI